MIRLHGKVRLGPRLAWLLHFGRWPSEFIDHINGDRADNRIANLRDVPHAANMRNRRDAPLLSTSGTPTKGVRNCDSVSRFAVR
jgi:hypothetical protein